MSQLFVKEGKTGVVSLVTYDGINVRLQNNGLNESGFDITDMDYPPIVEYLLGLMPYFLHEDPKSAFVVGYGGGFTTKALTLTEGLKHIKVVELEPVIVEAGRYIYKGDIPMLQDPRVTLEFNDARNTLLLEDTKYDLIAAQPSHPWLSRASTVFTRDFFKVVKSRLKENGIYGQWLSMFNMDATTMRAIMKGFYEVFPEGFTMADVSSGDFLMFGSANPLTFNMDRVSKRFNEEAIKKGMAYYDLEDPQDLFWYFALSRDQALEAAGDIVPNTDMNILSEVRLSKLDRNATGDESPYELLWDNYTLDADPILGEKEEAAEIYYSYAQALYRWGEYQTINHIIRNLLPLDELKSRTVDFEYARELFNYDGAIELYAKHDDWTDSTHQQLADIMMVLQRFDDARKAIKHISDKTLVKVANAKLLYHEKKYRQLAALKPTSDEEIMWQLSGLAKLNVKKAGASLVALKDKVSFEETQLRNMVQYYAAIDDNDNMNAAIRRLDAFNDKQAKKLKKGINLAVDNKMDVRARSLFARLESMKPNINGIDKLRQKVKALETATVTSSNAVSKTATSEK